MELFEAPAFTRLLNQYLDEEQYRLLQQHLAENPDIGDMMSDTGGFRKARWHDRRRGKGKRGGIRVIYYWFPEDQQIWLMTLFSKDEIQDLTPDQKRLLKKSIELETSIRKRKIGK